MKPVIIIAIAVLCSVVAVFGTQFLFVGNNEIIIDNQRIMKNEFIMDNEIFNSLTFDCAKQWDEYYDSYNKMQGRLGDSYKQSMKTIEAEEIGIGFLVLISYFLPALSTASYPLLVDFSNFKSNFFDAMYSP